MHHIWVPGVIVIFFLIFCVCICSSLELRYIPQRHREHVFTSGIDHEETLTWAVKLSLSLVADGDDDIEPFAEAIATDIGLINHGQIGSLDGYYIFSHPSGIHTPQVSFSSSLLRMDSQDEWRRIQDEVHGMLDRHPFVKWYMLQRVMPRFVRTSKQHHRKTSLSVPSSYSSLHFNDPLYHKQWHLVGICICVFVYFHKSILTQFCQLFFGHSFDVISMSVHMAAYLKNAFHKSSRCNFYARKQNASRVCHRLGVHLSARPSVRPSHS